MSAELKKEQGAFKRNGIIFHGSSVDVSGKALLFLGFSGAGKSTISQLLSERYPVIADDKVFVSQANNGCWMVRDASSNSWSISHDKKAFGYNSYPLFAALRIFKSDCTRIDPISQKETCKYLMNAVFEIIFQSRIRDQKVCKEWFGMAAQISRNLEGWNLTFPKSISIINIIHDVFEERLVEMNEMAKTSKVYKELK